MAEFDRIGLLKAPEPRLAADHFVALTFALLHNSIHDTAELDPIDDRMIVEGVRAFLRAYGAGSTD